MSINSKSKIILFIIPKHQLKSKQTIHSANIIYCSHKSNGTGIRWI